MQARRPRDDGRGEGAGNRWAERLQVAARIDPSPSHRVPAPLRLVLATVLALGASLGADEGLAHGATTLWPAIAGFAHFRFSDYATLTVVGVLGACLAWPFVVRVCTAPRWLFLRLAVLVTLVLWVPDLWILGRGEPARAVGTLMVMHLAIAVVTYNALVRLAPARPLVPDYLPEEPRTGPANLRRAWDAMAVLVGLEFALGVATIMVVPLGRAAMVFPKTGTAVYVAHAGLGLVLGVGALTLLALPPPGKMARAGAAIGAGGVALAGAGGILAEFHPARMAGMALMLIGTVVGAVGYLLPALEAFGESERQRAGVPPARTHPPEA